MENDIPKSKILDIEIFMDRQKRNENSRLRNYISPTGVD